MVWYFGLAVYVFVGCCYGGCARLLVMLRVVCLIVLLATGLYILIGWDYVVEFVCVLVVVRCAFGCLRWLFWR